MFNCAKNLESKDLFADVIANPENNDIGSIVHCCLFLFVNSFSDFTIFFCWGRNFSRNFFSVRGLCYKKIVYYCYSFYNFPNYR